MNVPAKFEARSRDNSRKLKTGQALVTTTLPFLHFFTNKGARRSIIASLAYTRLEFPSSACCTAIRDDAVRSASQQYSRASSLLLQKRFNF